MMLEEIRKKVVFTVVARLLKIVMVSPALHLASTAEDCTFLLPYGRQSC
jgi:hypothetical protein